jgi:hypothetical protein
LHGRRLLAGAGVFVALGIKYWLSGHTVIMIGRIAVLEWSGSSKSFTIVI